MRTLPAEWHHQDLVQLTWPHADTDWAPLLPDVIDCYCQIAHEIARRQPLLIITPDIDETRRQLGNTENIRFVSCPTNDTWARDHAFISTLDDDGQRHLLDFQFNGWGMKFAANHDNYINRHLRDNGTLAGIYEPHLDFVLEGGSIESDGCGTILTTASCLLAPNRNDMLTPHDIEQQLLRFFNARQVLWLHHGYLAGDDTDGHIDTLARLCPDHTIAYVSCSDPFDEHFSELQLMEQELRQLRTLSGQPYRLIPLPMPAAIYEEDFAPVPTADKSDRLPATYANFLIINGAVLYPTYAQPNNDEQARRQLQQAFPHHDIVGIDCRVLIRQHGSLHCCTMQYPSVSPQ